MDEPGEDLVDELEERRKNRVEGKRPRAASRRKAESADGSGSGRRGTRVGAADSDGGSSGRFGLYGIRVGATVSVRIANEEAGGYFVYIEQGKNHLPGFLPCTERFKTGERILATFVCIHKNRGLLTREYGERKV